MSRLTALLVMLVLGVSLIIGVNSALALTPEEEAAFNTSNQLIVDQDNSAVDIKSKNVFISSMGKTGKAMGYVVGSGLEENAYTKTGLYISLILSFVGVIFLVLAIYAGYLWMMAQGNEKEVDKAKKILTEVVIGLIIVTSAYIITQFVGSSIKP